VPSSSRPSARCSPRSTTESAMTSKIGALRELLLGLLREHESDGALPTSARFLYYELVRVAS